MGEIARALAGLGVALIAAACFVTGPLDQTGDVPDWPTVPEELPTADAGSDELTATCNGRAFPVSGLDAPPGAEHEVGPEFDALRAGLERFREGFPGSGDWTWRLAGRDELGAVFLARTDALGPPGWVGLEVRKGADGWEAIGMGQCEPLIVLAPGFGPATWALDPRFPAPGPDSTDIYMLVWERACSGGSPTTGRMSPAIVEYGPGTVAITIGVRPRPGGHTCPGPPGTPVLVRLSEPLGSRSLLDGGRVPPAPPSED